MSDLFPPFEPERVESRRARFKPIPFRLIAPNLVTLLALCLGLTAMRLVVEGKLETATICILIAAALDGVDGRLARLLKGTSRFGAELDSLSDFVNFGVATGYVLWIFVLHDLRSFGWIIVLTLACAMALQGPCYVRVSRDAVPVLPATLADGQPFGGVKRIWDEGEDFAIVYEGSALAAAADGFALLRSNGKKGKMVQVQTLKPFPGAALMQMIGGVQKIVTVENHSVVGGLGSAVADELCRQPAHPPLLRVGVPDVFTQSGSTAAVKSRYGLSGAHIAQLLEG